MWFRRNQKLRLRSVPQLEQNWSKFWNQRLKPASRVLPLLLDARWFCNKSVDESSKMGVWWLWPMIKCLHFSAPFNGKASPMKMWSTLPCWWSYMTSIALLLALRSFAANTPWQALTWAMCHMWCLLSIQHTLLVCQMCSITQDHLLP